MARLIFILLKIVNKIWYSYVFFLDWIEPPPPLKKKSPLGFGYFHDKHVTTVNNTI